MKPERYIIKGKDQTEKIASIRYQPGGKYSVSYKNGSKTYNYYQSSVRVEKLVREISPSEVILSIDGISQKDLVDIGKYQTVFVLEYPSGKSRSVPSSRIEIVRSCLEDDNVARKVQYYRAIINQTGLHTENGSNILARHYQNLSIIREDSILAAYLKGDLRNNYQPYDDVIVFPFGVNASQSTAVHNALTSRLSVIQGPPGTGKTQTILNIIANLVMAQKSVAVVSNNNSATDNIYEKLQSAKVDFISARLGRSQNKDEFIDTQSRLDAETLRGWVMDSQDVDMDTAKLQSLSVDIERLLQDKNKLARAKEELVAVEAEYYYYAKNAKSSSEKSPVRFWRRVSAAEILKLWLAIDTKAAGQKMIWWRRIYAYMRYGTLDASIFEQDRYEVISRLHKQYYEMRREELAKVIRDLENRLANARLDEKLTAYSEISEHLFRLKVATRWLKEGERRIYRRSDLQTCAKEFIEDYPVILSTTYSLRSSLSVDHMYDYVIVDESSQVDLATFVLALSCARSAVVVGDTKQLPNVITDEVKKINASFVKEYGIETQYSFADQSALSSVVGIFGDGVPTQLLREHYRCHPKIIGFCNSMFYNNELIIHTPEQANRMPMKVYKTVKGNHARGDHVNERQIDVTFNEVVPRERLDLSSGDVGIVTPYRNQASAFMNRLQGTKTLAATVDKFQGREKDTIIISTVDNQISDFASNPNRLNVAVSRAKSQLIIVTNDNDNSGISELLEYIRYHNFETVESKTRSVFDNLYSSYYAARRLKNVSEFPSENLMYDLIDKTLSETYPNLGCVPQYPLSQLCDLSALEGRRLQYAENTWTRVDFIIYQKTSKRPVLAVEVDGHAYHAHNDKQRERDELKNNILADIGLSLVRFRTTGSGEKEKLLEALKQALG